MAEFSFDVKMFATIRVEAVNEKAARKELQDKLDCAEANLGAWSNGDPILAEVSIDGEADLIEVDGEGV